MKPTTLHRNAFYILGATIRDDRRKIVELAEEKSLELDHEVCQKARSDLTNPRTRLSVEMAWLSGVSPKKSNQLISQVIQDPMSIRLESGIPLLAHANLMAVAFESVNDKNDPHEITDFILELAYCTERLSTDNIMRDINEDRTVSGFPEIRAIDLIESELVERKRYFKTTIKDALNRLPPFTLVEVMTLTVDCAIAGDCHAPELIDELVDSYEIEAQGFLQKEAENIKVLIDTTRNTAKRGEIVTTPLIAKIEDVTRNWDKVAQPIQLSAKARGIKHHLSIEVAELIRNLAIDIVNEHNLLSLSHRLMILLKELFSELPELASKVEEDTEALQDIVNNQKVLDERKRAHDRGITYSVDVGLIFKDKFSISPNGVQWKNRSYSLDSITRIRWGGINHYLNGRPNGSVYTVAFGDNKSETVITLKQENIYSPIIDKLWRAIGTRMLMNMLAELKSGKEIRFGNAVLKDDGITLHKRNIWTANENIHFLWHQINIWSAGGNFYVAHKDDKKTCVELSYITNPNTHVLENAIRMGFAKPGLRKLSELL